MRIVLFWAIEVITAFVVLGVHEEFIKPWSMRFVRRINHRIRQASPEVFKRLDPILAHLMLTRSGDELDQLVRDTFAEVTPEHDWSQVDLAPFYEMLDVRKVADKTVPDLGLPASPPLH